MDEQFIRTQMLLGNNAIQQLQRSHVAVFGLGGVGSWCAEALCRSGISEQSSRFAARRKTCQSRRLSRQENAVGLSHSRSQKERFRSPHRFSTRSGKAASTRMRT